jgi:hypothetical protein
MTSSAIKKQVEGYLPMLSRKQQELVLDMIKGLLNVDSDSQRISKKQYNKEIDAAVSRIDKGAKVSHKDALKALSKW